MVVGTCKVCAEKGISAKLVAHKSERSGKRFIRCENYDECGTSYPLPARGELHATGEVCPDCGAPMVEVVTQRGPWKFCVNMDCPAKEKQAATRGRGSRARAGAKSGTAKAPSSSKSSAAKKSAKPKPKRAGAKPRATKATSSKKGE